MIGKTENALGDIILDEAVISRIAATVASGSYGVVGMAHRSATEGVVNLLKGETASKGVKVIIGEDNALSIHLHIVTQYGLNITAISESIIHNVRYQVTEMTGFPVKEVIIHVESIRSEN